MGTAATELPTVTETRKGKPMSDNLWNKIIERGEALRRGNLDRIKIIDYEIKKIKRKERKEYIAFITRIELDPRDRFLGIRQFKKEYQPKTYYFKNNKTGQPVALQGRAEYAAEHLEEVTWKNHDACTSSSSSSKEATKQTNIITEKIDFNTGKITMEELEEYIKKAKKRKSPGPDGIPMEFYKAMNFEMKSMKY